jgi:hypothetical protein
VPVESIFSDTPATTGCCLDAKLEEAVIQPQTEISRQRRNLFSVEQVAKTIGADGLLPLKDHIVLSVSDTPARITNETNQRGHQMIQINLPPKDPNDDDEDEEDDQDEPKEDEPAVVREPDER